MKNNENMIYTKGFVNDGCIDIPGVYLEEGITVELAIKAVSGKLEVAMFPSQEDKIMADECDEVICTGDCNDCILNKMEG